MNVKVFLETSLYILLIIKSSSQEIAEKKNTFPYYVLDFVKVTYTEQK